jgi:hypothetical protein
MAARDAHHQSHPGSRIAEIEGFARREKRTDPATLDEPAAFAAPLRLGAERRAGGGGAQNVVAFEQALDFGLPHAKEPGIRPSVKPTCRRGCTRPRNSPRPAVSAALVPP